MYVRIPKLLNISYEDILNAMHLQNLSAHRKTIDTY